MRPRPPMFWIRWIVLLVGVVLLDQFIHRILFPEQSGLARYLIGGAEMVVIYGSMSWLYSMGKGKKAASK
jgi:hypothetical protein